MRVVTATATIREDHVLTMPVPRDIPAGQQAVVVVLERSSAIGAPARSLHLTPHQTGPVDITCTYRREDLYGDDGR